MYIATDIGEALLVNASGWRERNPRVKGRIVINTLLRALVVMTNTNKVLAQTTIDSSAFHLRCIPSQGF